MMEVYREGTSYTVIMTHDEVVALAAGAPLTILLGPEVAAPVEAISDALSIIDEIGGNNGVEITGTIGSSAVIALPRGLGLWGTLIRNAVDIATVAALISDPPALIARFGIPALIRAVGNPWGARHGEVHADENAIGDEESLVLICHTDGKVSFLSHTGYFCADLNRNEEIWADRETVGDWEKWKIIRNGDDTISLISSQGHNACTDYNNGEKMIVHGGGIADWEKFHLDFIVGGRCGLRAHVGNRYASAAN